MPVIWDEYEKRKELELRYEAEREARHMPPRDCCIECGRYLTDDIEIVVVDGDPYCRACAEFLSSELMWEGVFGESPEMEN
jgi:hypothetical protein